MEEMKLINTKKDCASCEPNFEPENALSMLWSADLIQLVDYTLYSIIRKTRVSFSIFRIVE